MSKLLSIIIPTYNMELYLEKCLNSLIVNRLDLIEVIVVNDGSKDNSSLIAHRYQNKYPNSFYVIDKENGNYGSCINSGLKTVSGKYVKILDADDTFDSHILERFLECLISIDTDLVITDFVVLKNDKAKKQSYSFPIGQLLSFDDYYIDNDLLNLQMHGLTYKTKILKDISYKQSEGISYTDQEWIWYPMKEVEKFYYFDIPLYHYVLGREGQTMEPSIFVKKMPDQYRGVLKMINEYLSTSFHDEKHQKHLYQRLLNRIVGLYRFYLLDNPQLNTTSLKKFDTDILNLYSELHKDIRNSVVHKYYGFKYINYWISNGYKKLPFYYLLGNYLFRILLTIFFVIKKKILKRY